MCMPVSILAQANPIGLAPSKRQLSGRLGKNKSTQGLNLSGALGPPYTPFSLSGPPKSFYLVLGICFGFPFKKSFEPSGITLLIAPRPSLQIPSWLPSWESNGRWSLRPLFPYTNYPYSPGRSEAILDLNRVLQTPFYNGGSPITDLPSGYQP